MCELWQQNMHQADAHIFTCLRRYMVHLPQIVSLDTRQYEWVDAANHFPTLLSYDGSALGRKLTGTTDVVVVSRGTVKGHQKEVGLVLLFELRKKVDAASVAQAQLGLLLANIHSPELRPVMVRQTLLLSTWQLTHSKVDLLNLCSEIFDLLIPPFPFLSVDPNRGQPRNSISGHARQQDQQYNAWGSRDVWGSSHVLRLLVGADGPP